MANVAGSGEEVLDEIKPYSMHVGFALHPIFQPLLILQLLGLLTIPRIDEEQTPIDETAARTKATR